MENLLYQIAIIALASIGAQWIGWKLHLPAIVFLLLFGFALGPLTGLVQPDILMGDLMQPALGAAVAIILFEASLNLRFREIREVRRAVKRIVFLGAPVGWLFISLGAYYIGGLGWPVAITLGGFLIVTGPTVIIPLLHNARLNPRVASILRWEGIINDPLGVIFAILAYEYFVYSKSPDLTGVDFLAYFGTSLIVISFASYIFGRFTAYALERGYMPEFLKTPFLMSCVIALFTIGNAFVHESGLIAVTIYGMTLGNVRMASIEEIKRFKETITLMLVSGVFILLTADLDPAVLLQIDIRGALFVLALIFVIRPSTIFLASLGSHMSWQEVVLVSWIAPRGVVCAAISGVLGPLLVNAGFEDGEKILPLAFALVILTVLLHSFTLKPLARRLQLAADRAGGLIIVGASDWTIQLAEALIARDVPVILVDTSWHHLRPARLANIPVYYGEFLSEETEFNLELNRYGTLLAATDNSAYNTLVCNAFAPELGRENVYQVSAHEEGGSERKKMPNTLQGRTFVGPEKDYISWWYNFFDGWRFRATRPNPEEGAESKGGGYNEDNDILIGVIGKNGVLGFRTPDFTPQIKEGDLLLLFSKVNTKENKAANAAEARGADTDISVKNG